MTTNQTIDGVPRADLEFALGFKCHGHKNRTDQAADMQNARDKLRALLDAPVKDPCAQAIKHLERLKDVARSGDVIGIIEMGAELIGMAYFDNSEASENVERTNPAVHGSGVRCNSDSACISKHDIAAQPQGEPVA